MGCHVLVINSELAYMIVLNTIHVISLSFMS